MNRCGSFSVTAFQGKATLSDVKTKSCSSVEQCVQGSLNFGVVRTLMTSMCCDTNLCNTQNAPEVSPTTKPNGKKCYQCGVQAGCTETLNCDNDEDYCISASVNVGNQVVLMKGCATKSICSEKTTNTLGTGTFSCCQGDLCNGSTVTSASFLLLVTMMSLFLSN